jgi:predicted protein tyrosine phosphatase
LIKILFICSRNKRRSRTAEKIFKNRQDIDVKSAGFSKKSPVKVSEKDLDWADLILVMEYRHSKRLKELFHQIKIPELGVLKIPDDYEFTEERLIHLIEEKTSSAIEQYLQ